MRDPLLQTIAAAVEKSDAEVPILLTVQGVQVSGVVVKRSHFFDDLEKMGGVAVKVEPPLASTAAPDAQAGQQIRVGADDVDSQHFIHLRDANFYGTARGIPAMSTPRFMRIALDHVGCFSVGTLHDPAIHKK